MKFLSQQLCFSPNIYIYKAILVGVLQGLYFLPIHDSWAFIPIFFFLLHCWFLLDLFSHSQNPQKLLLFSYLFLLPSCAIRYGWIFSSLWIYGNYNWVSSLFFYFLGVHWIILIHLVCFSAILDTMRLLSPSIIGMLGRAKRFFTLPSLYIKLIQRSKLPYKFRDVIKNTLRFTHTFQPF